MEDKYYVYEYIRLDTNEPFYIGKGSGDRWRIRNRGKCHFTNICNKVPVAVIILHDNLDEKTAFEYECWYIWQLRDIQGYSLINGTDGGEGLAGYKHNVKTKSKIGNSLKLKCIKRKHLKGKTNPFYGKTHSEDFCKKQSERTKGKNHPHYGKRGSEAPYKKSVCIIKENEVIKTFNTVSLLEKHIKENYPKPNGATKIRYCLKSGEEIHGLKFAYVNMEKVMV
ncbi:MAG TPA: NUMOD3 domain-containing DNA-binding protein [Pseudoneobacillus sp.]|nr:NUMOD3 domain-containing DNA-binding protein [Pseudoneobacillus sp.]